MTTAFVLGGGGLLGACEAGMALALLDADIRPDLILGTSIGALNGAVIAADPSPASARRLAELWGRLEDADVLGGTMLSRIGRLVVSRTHLQSDEPLRRLLAEQLPAVSFEDLVVPFQCVAASIERAAEHWFTAGDLVSAVLASAALPGVLPPVEIDGEHFVDGGLVNSIPIARAVQLGATTVFVLHVGRIEEPLTVPRLPWEVGFVAFEIARRHRFNADLAAVPEGVTVHVLPTGLGPRRPSTWSNLRYADTRRVGQRIELSRAATADYLESIRPPG